MTLSQTAVRSRARRRWSGSACRTASRSSCATTARSTASSTRSPRSACSSMSASPIIRAYFSTVHRLLAPRRALSASRHRAAGQARPTRTSCKKSRRNMWRSTRYIFPGGELDHIGMSVAQPRALRLRGARRRRLARALRAHLRLWHDRLLANYDAAIREVGEVEDAAVAGLSGRLLARLRRAARSAFSRRWRRSAKRGASGLPPTRADLYR